MPNAIRALDIACTALALFDGITSLTLEKLVTKRVASPCPIGIFSNTSH